MQAYLDLGISPKNVHFLSHSLLRLQQPYLSLHAAVLESSKAHIESAEIAREAQAVAAWLEADLALLTRIFIPATVRQVQCMYADYELSLWKHHFQARYMSNWTTVTAKLREEVAETHLSSSFALFLFELKPCKSQIRAFLESILSEDSSNLTKISRFNDLTQTLVEAGSASLADEELEYCAGREQRTLEQAQEGEEQPDLEMVEGLV